jgi:hypothetical protein
MNQKMARWILDQSKFLEFDYDDLDSDPDHKPPCMHFFQIFIYFFQLMEIGSIGNIATLKVTMKYTIGNPF